MARNETPVTESAALLARGVCRLLAQRNIACLTELTLASGRRPDVAGLDKTGRILFVEIKRSTADFRSDVKWTEYLPYCDFFYFAVPPTFPREILPTDTGLIVADRYGGEIVREAEETPVNASRRRSVIRMFALTAAERLRRLNDPEG